MSIFKRVGSKAVKFKFGVIVKEVHINASFIGGDRKTEASVRWTRGIKAALTKKIGGKYEPSQDTLSFMWGVMDAMFMMGTLYQRNGTFQKKDSVISVALHSSRGEQKWGNYTVNLSDFVHPDASAEYSKEFRVPLKKCPDSESYIILVVFSKPLDVRTMPSTNIDTDNLSQFSFSERGSYYEDVGSDDSSNSPTMTVRKTRQASVPSKTTADMTHSNVLEAARKEIEMVRASMGARLEQEQAHARQLEETLERVSTSNSSLVDVNKQLLSVNDKLRERLDEMDALRMENDLLLKSLKSQNKSVIVQRIIPKQNNNQPNNSMTSSAVNEEYDQRFMSGAAKRHLERVRVHQLEKSHEDLKLQLADTRAHLEQALRISDQQRDRSNSSSSQGMNKRDIEYLDLVKKYEKVRRDRAKLSELVSALEVQLLQTRMLCNELENAHMMPASERLA